MPVDISKNNNNTYVYAHPQRLLQSHHTHTAPTTSNPSDYNPPPRPVQDRESRRTTTSTPARPPPSRRVAYISSPSLRSLASHLPSNPGRSHQVHDLISAFGLIDVPTATDGSDNSDDVDFIPVHDDHPQRGDGSPRANRTVISNKCRVVAPVKATRRDLLRFHDADYVGRSSLNTAYPRCPLEMRPCHVEPYKTAKTCVKGNTKQDVNFPHI